MDSEVGKSQTVVELKAIAKQLGLKRYSRLRKAELIQFIRQNRPPPPVPTPRHVNTSKANEFGDLEPPDQDLDQDLVKIPNVKPYQMKPKQTRRQKREEKNFEMQSPVELVNDKPRDKQIKRIKKKLQKVNKKIKNNKKQKSNLLSKINELWKELENLKPTDGGQKEQLEERLFKLEESKSALKKFATQYTIDGVKGYVPKTFLSAVKPVINRFLKEHRNIKLKIILKCIMSKTNIATGEVEYTPAAFQSNVEIILQGTDLDDLYLKMTGRVLENLATFQMRGSNWVFETIDSLELHTVKYEPLSGSSYIPLPKKLLTKKAIINMKNKDDECFKWCVTRALNPVNEHAERITKELRKQSEEHLRWDGIEFPLELCAIQRFETLNENRFGVNVFGYDRIGYKAKVYPLRILRISKNKCSTCTHINLLLISNGEKKHYCLINDMSRLLSSQKSK